MTAPFPVPAAEAIQAEIEMLICQLDLAQSRQQIADAWVSGNIDGDEAMECLVEFGLIEFTPESTP